eukprot:11086521-Ditylum_brightwellii.AAC.1
MPGEDNKCVSTQPDIAAVVTPDSSPIRHDLESSDHIDYDQTFGESIVDEWSKLVTILTTAAPTCHMDAVRDLFTDSNKPNQISTHENQAFNNDELSSNQRT